MKNVIVWGYGYIGYFVYKELLNNNEYYLVGFADNDIYKQGNYVDGKKILSVTDVCELSKHQDLSIIIAVNNHREIEEQLLEAGLKIEAKVIRGEIVPYNELARFDLIDLSKSIELYAGDVCEDDERRNNIGTFFGLSLTQNDRTHILHDITEPYPLPDDSIDYYQAEDVLEHIARGKIKGVMLEIKRILKPGGLCRISLPDYQSPVLKGYVLRDKYGEILFDAQGGGKYEDGKIISGGHIWFPVYEEVKQLLDEVGFSKMDFLRYYEKDGTAHKEYIDMDKGKVRRCNNDFDKVNDDFSIVVDCYK